MKKEKLFLLAIFCSLFMLNSCQNDDQENTNNNNENTLNTESLITDLLNSVTITDSGISSDCLAISYPLTILTYNSNLQQGNSYTIANNEQLYALLFNFPDDEYYAIGYPVTITVSGGAELIINNNDDLLDALQDAIDNCEPVSNCDNPGILLNDLVIYMPFSNTFNDLMGANVNASSSITFITDRAGNANCAVSFQGNQEFIEISSTTENAIVDGDSFSVSFWFKMQNTEVGNFENLFRKGMGNNGFYIAAYDMNTPLFGTNSDSLWDQPWNEDSDLWNDTDNWHHLVITFDNDSMAKLYRDGELQNSEDFSGGSISADAMNYYLGQYFTGYIDDLRVYKRTLNSAEVQVLFELDGDCNTCLE